MNIDDFLKIESKYDLYHIEIEGIQCWQYIRFSLWNHQICSFKLGLASSVIKKAKTEYAVRVIKSLCYILLHPEKRKLYQSDVCIIAHERRVLNNGKYECIYTDHIKEKYYPDAITLERPYDMQHLKPARTKNMYYLDFISAVGNFQYQIQMRGKTKHYQKVQREVHRLFEKPLNEIIRSYDLKIGKEELEEQLTKAVIEGQILKKHYERILNIIRPKVILEVVGYSKTSMVVNDLAKKQGITTIELQHGTMHKDHIAYQYAQGCGEIAQFPDILLTFSDYWKHCINVPIKYQAVKGVGFPYFEQKVRQYSGKKRNGKINVLFLSQSTIGKELSGMAMELVKMLDMERWHIIYKLHPTEYDDWEKLYPWLDEEQIEVVDASGQNLYDYFSRCEIQVGVYSTAIYEGLGFGLQTFIYRIGYADTMKELCDQGYGTFVDSSEELRQKLQDGMRNSKTASELFWKANALENIYEVIEQFKRSSGEGIGYQ